MLDPESTRENDFSKVLPSVMGFPAKVGAGNHPLRPYGSGEYNALAFVFALEIVKRRKPMDALAHALHDSRVPEHLIERDTKTLLQNIAKLFMLDRVPRSNTGWRTAIETSLPFLKTLFPT
jgi:hypothetical protein